MSTLSNLHTIWNDPTRLLANLAKVSLPPSKTTKKLLVRVPTEASPAPALPNNQHAPQEKRIICLDVDRAGDQDGFIERLQKNG